MKYSALGLLALTTLTAHSHAAEKLPTTAEMWETIKQQRTEIEQLKAQQQRTDAKVEATADALDNGGSSVSWADKTFIGGYGEHHFNNIQGGDDKVDAHRFVLFINHEYSDTIKFFSEFELEHSLAGEGKPGEVELEQAYIEWQYASNHKLTAGLFLIPVGILNETHEPDTFYGTERNSVEARIIPTTWWETGVMLSGDIAPGLTYDFAVHSGLNTSASSNIRSGRQKSAEAVANEFAYTGRLKYTAIPGLELATTLQYQSDMSQGAAASAESGTLLEAHAVYTTGPFSVRALYATWDIDGDEYAAAGSDEQTGYYLEPGYKILNNLGLFVRYSVWNNAAASASEDNKALDVGLNYWLHDRVVIKADYQSGQSDSVSDSLNLGLGWSF